MKLKFAIEAVEKWGHKEIGGDLDVLELKRVGASKWIYVKEQCKN
jgi:hypothetical protein